MSITSAIVDSREPDWARSLTFGGVPTVVMALDSGDVWATCSDHCTVLIERKTPSDLLSTLRQKRFFPQCAKMLEVTPWSYVVITGILYHDRTGMVTISGAGHTGWRFDDVQGALLTAQEMGVGVLTCGSDADFEATVIRLCNRERGTVRIKPPREGYLLRNGEAALAALPGIGTDRVKALTTAFGSVANILEWLTNLGDTRTVPGVADGTKQGVRRALGMQNGERLLSVPQGALPFFTPNGGYVAADELAREYISEMGQ